MKKILSFNKKFKKQFNTWLDRLNFFSIFVIWIGTIIIFGLIYFFFTTDRAVLLSNLTKQPIYSIVDIIYFSFVTATTTGFGDIIPFGGYRIIAVLEVIFGLVLLALVTSKLVSLKQNVILNEIYDISFNERINRIRSSLLLFRQNINRLIARVEEKTAKKRETNEIHIYFSSLEDVIKEISTLLSRGGKNHFTKAIAPVDTELIFNSVVSSFKRTSELVDALDENQSEWKNDTNLSSVYRCLSLNKELFEKLGKSKLLPETVVKEICSRNTKVIESIKSEIANQNRTIIS